MRFRRLNVARRRSIAPLSAFAENPKARWTNFANHLNRSLKLAGVVALAS
jgi:hypothetical protein